MPSRGSCASTSTLPRREPPGTAEPPAGVVAVTDGVKPTARRRNPRFLRDLPWLAAGLGSLAARDAFGQSSIDTRFLFYKESGGRTEVLNPVALIHEDFGDTYGHLNLLLG